MKQLQEVARILVTLALALIIGGIIMQISGKDALNAYQVLWNSAVGTDRAIADTLPMVVVDRPGATFTLTSAPAAIALSRFRIDEGDAALLPSMKPPVWTFVHGPRSALSSTRIRASTGNRGTGPASSGALGQG